jgi:GNAT superfamily N-acetyltransferase
VSRPPHSTRELERRDAAACDAIVASLPYHFGLESGRRDCAAAVRSQAGLVAEAGGDVVGFLTWRPWYAAAREITWMAVHRAHRGGGAGRDLIEHLVRESRPSVRYLVVTTLAESTPEPGVEDGYARTRRFYTRNGFDPVWEPSGWWSGDNQAVVMVRVLAPAT